MKLDSLRLYNYRNISELEINFFPGINIFYGDNAQGKTNILEAIFFISCLKTIRSSKEQDLIRHKMSTAFIKGVFSSDLSCIEREIIIFNGKKKIVKENSDIKNKWSELYENINAIFFSPDDLSLVKGEPSIRRKFLDTILYQIRPGYYKYLQNYYKVLAHRNTLLKNIKKSPSLQTTLDSWDTQLAELGGLLIKSRLKIINEITPFYIEFFKKFNNEVSDIELKYNCTVKFDKVETISQDFYYNLKHNRSKDIEKTYTTIGPHRDDLEFKLNGYNVKTYGSQGQQRLVVLSMKFAQREIFLSSKGIYPLMLLDDVMSELDYTRRSFILENENNQVFLTTTDLKFIPDEIVNKSAIFHVKSGSIEVT